MIEKTSEGEQIPYIEYLNCTLPYNHRAAIVLMQYVGQRVDNRYGCGIIQVKLAEGQHNELMIKFYTSEVEKPLD